MADSIREQLLTAFGVQLATILTTNQYASDMGARVYRSFLPSVDYSQAPCVGYHVDQEQNTSLYARKEENVLPIGVQGIALYGAVDPAVMAERLYADIGECVLSPEWSLSFDSGGTTPIVAGNTIAGQTSGAQGLVISVSVTSGSWGQGNAAGSFVLRRIKSGLFVNNEELSVGVATGMATVNGTLSGQLPVELAGGGIADAITFVSGEIMMPDADGLAVGVNLVFHVRYKKISGNPYSQT